MTNQFSDRLQRHVLEIQSIVQRMYKDDEGFEPVFDLVEQGDKLQTLVLDMRDEETKRNEM